MSVHYSNCCDGFLLQFERFLPPDATAVASVYAPITFPPAGVLMFKNTKDGEQYRSSSSSSSSSSSAV